MLKYMIYILENCSQDSTLPGYLEVSLPCTLYNPGKLLNGNLYKMYKLFHYFIVKPLKRLFIQIKINVHNSTVLLILINKEILYQRSNICPIHYIIPFFSCFNLHTSQYRFIVHYLTGTLIIL